MFSHLWRTKFFRHTNLGQPLKRTTNNRWKHETQFLSTPVILGFWTIRVLCDASAGKMHTLAAFAHSRVQSLDPTLSRCCEAPRKRHVHHLDPKLGHPRRGVRLFFASMEPWHKKTNTAVPKCLVASNTSNYEKSNPSKDGPQLLP